MTIDDLFEIKLRYKLPFSWDYKHDLQDSYYIVSISQGHIIQHDHRPNLTANDMSRYRSHTTFGTPP